MERPYPRACKSILLTRIQGQDGRHSRLPRSAGVAGVTPDKAGRTYLVNLPTPEEPMKLEEPSTQ